MSKPLAGLDLEELQKRLFDVNVERQRMMIRVKVIQGEKQDWEAKMASACKGHEALECQCCELVNEIRLRANAEAEAIERGLGHDI